MYPWFGNWYMRYNAEKPKHSDNRLLLYPCWRFNRAQAFLDVTRQLVYGFEGYVMDKNPTKLKDPQHFLPSRVYRQYILFPASITGLTFDRTTECR